MYQYFDLFSSVFFFVFVVLLICTYHLFVKEIVRAAIFSEAILPMTVSSYLILFLEYFSLESMSPLTQDFFFGAVYVVGVASVIHAIYVLVQLKQEERKKASVYKPSVELNEVVYYSTTDICYCLMQYAKEYVKTKHVVSNEVRDAVLVDFINYIGLTQGVDFALYTSDLYKDDETVESKTIESNLLLSIMMHFFDKYIASNIPASVIRNKHMNELQEDQEVDEYKCVAILAGFMNYIVMCSNIKGRDYCALRKT